MKHCLKQLDKKFTVIAISETWLNEEQATMMHIEGYDMFFINGTQKRDGGVALYTKKSYESKSVSSIQWL